MKKFPDRTLCAALMVNTFFAVKQLCLCLVFCAVFHTHTHDFCQEKVVIRAVDCDICCIHCSHSGESCFELKKISQAPLEEKKPVFCSGDTAGEPLSEDFRYLLAHISKKSCIAFMRSDTIPALRSMVLRC